ncbi:MAG TPA: triose-phosphate isomerase [Candidatus Sulfotelmatobacter sp.]|nr:triose-phosphate isomerase [Candidatus Sulfotelmatobacter sp.]
MRPVIIAGNWKMHTTPAEAADLARALAAATAEPAVVRVFCPPFVALAAVRDALDGAAVAVGAQNVHHEAAGAYTGEVAAAMLPGLATWAIVGHSERRRDAGETDAQIGQKLRRCLEAGLRPILCVGEGLEDREAGRADAVVRDQLDGAWASFTGGAADGRDDGAALAAQLVVAYEPVWAIGTGRTARGADAAEMARRIRRTIAAWGWPAAAADAVPVLYGGSVTSATAEAFLAEPDLDGALVGGASLKVEEMAGIVARAALTARARRAAS